MQIRFLSPGFIVLLLLLLGGPALAVFKGEERYPREWTYNSEYFFQTESFLLPFWWDDTWRRGDMGYRVALGSVKTDEFYLFQEGKIGAELMKGVRMGYHFLNEEDFDSRSTRHIVSLEAEPDPKFRLGWFSELDAHKEWIDMGASASFRIPGTYEGSLAFTLVDMVFNSKGRDQGKYERVPFTLETSHTLHIRPGLDAVLSVEADLPLRLADDRNGFLFSFHRYRVKGKVTWEISPHWTVHAGGSWETAGKRWEFEPYTPPGDPYNPLEQAFYRSAFSIRTEVLWRPSAASRNMVNVGWRWIQLREVSEFPYNHVEDNRLTKQDVILWVRVRWDLGAGFFTLPALYLGPVDHRLHYTHQPWENHTRRIPVNSKLNVAFGYRFSDRAILMGCASFALDRFEFDGGQGGFILAF